MRPVVVIAVVAAIIVGLVGLFVLDRIPKSDPIRTESVARATGTGFVVHVPPGYVHVIDERVEIPSGSVALGRTENTGRATIVVTPYPEEKERVLSHDTCETVARLHAKQVGAQLDRVEVEGTGTAARCRAELHEGAEMRGLMILTTVGDHHVMVTCRFPSQDDGGSDATACEHAAATLTTP